MKCRVFLAVAVIVLCGSTAWADYEAGQASWKAGRPAEALAQWQTAAKTGDARAMLALGRAYVKGLGVPQDYVEAHKWFNLSAARGNAEAADKRDAVASKMTTEEQAEARRLARVWRSGGRAVSPKSAAVPRAAPPSSPAGPPPPRAIREAQVLMTALGYNLGAPDGDWGPLTGRAYAAFLRDAGLPTGNELTLEALRAMRAAAKGRNVAASATLGLEIGQDAGQGAVKDRPLIGAVGEQFPEKGKQTEQGRQQRETAVAILNVGGGDDAVQQQALRIDQNMPLLALDQLAGIEAMAVDASPPFSALFTL